MKQKFVSLKFAIYIAINAEFIYEKSLNLINSQINKWQVIWCFIWATLTFALLPLERRSLVWTWKSEVAKAKEEKCKDTTTQRWKCKDAIRLSLLYLRTLIYNWNYADAVNELSYLLEVAECSRMSLVCMCQCGGTIKLTIDWVIWHIF